ncbi:hypothetical protein O4H52_07920 [Sphingomonadaceae bacterium G21617-S1]|nr:hypothetical protein [Sphingomonadaceae bacterium G21617-S1]
MSRPKNPTAAAPIASPVVNTSPAADTVAGSTGNDTIAAAVDQVSAGDTIVGSDGTDSISAPAGDDTAGGGAGDDAIVAPVADEAVDPVDPVGTEDESDFVEIVLTVSLAGAIAKAPGDTHRCSPAEAQRMRDAGYAEPAAA